MTRLRVRWQPWWWLLTAPDTRWRWHQRHHADSYHRGCSHCRRRRAIGAERLPSTKGTRS